MTDEKELEISRHQERKQERQRITEGSILEDLPQLDLERKICRKEKNNVLEKKYKLPPIILTNSVKNYKVLHCVLIMRVTKLISKSHTSYRRN